MSQFSNSSLYRNKSSEEVPLQDLKLIIKSQDDREHSFMMNGKKNLRKLFMAYCKKTNVEYGTVQFLSDGTLLSSNKTPLELGLQYGDTIEAMMSQIGGGFST